ncbi:MAG: FAD-dependent monooxygenase, partial [Hyphomonas sp.]
MTDRKILKTQCCIAGGGPAGVMLGYLLARQGVQVVVLEKHADFFRDFRGDTVHPSTLQAMSEMNLLESYLEKPFQKTDRLSVVIDEKEIPIADFRHLPVVAPYIAMMPQWEFLNHLAEQGRALPGFTLLMSTRAERVAETDGRVTALEAEGPDGPLTIEADLVVGADGRDSVLRDQSSLPIKDIGAPVD